MCTKEVPQQLIPSVAERPVPLPHPLVELSRGEEVSGVGVGGEAHGNPPPTMGTNP